MFELKKIHPAVNHLESISPNMFKDKGDHYMMFCPFCDDATRRPGLLSHGHCYVSTTSPVFYCHRCTAGGSLLKILLETGFTDQETLSYIKSFINHVYVKDYYQFGQKKINHNKTNIRNIVSEKVSKFATDQPENYIKYKRYLFNRLGDIDTSYFLLYPEFVAPNPKQPNSKIFGCSFMNFDGQHLTTRFIDDSPLRYSIASQNLLYYFQLKDFNRYNRIVLTEGPFDAIQLYTYCNVFDPINTLYISVCGKKFISNIEQLIFTELLLGDYEINLVFDNDVKNEFSYIYRATLLSKLYNENISIRGWKPLIPMSDGVNDVADYPAIVPVGE